MPVKPVALRAVSTVALTRVAEIWYPIIVTQLMAARLMLRSGKWSVAVNVEDEFAARRLLEQWGARKFVERKLGEQ